MQAAVRPFVTTGIALVGASVIAVTPITPATPPDIRVASPAVQLAAAPSPFVLYPQVAADALYNASILARMYLAEPFPIIQAILGQQVTGVTVNTAMYLVRQSEFSWVLAAGLKLIPALAEVGGGPINSLRAG